MMEIDSSYEETNSLMENEEIRDAVAQIGMLPPSLDDSELLQYAAPTFVLDCSLVEPSAAAHSQMQGLVINKVDKSTETMLFKTSDQACQAEEMLFGKKNTWQLTL